MINEEAKFLLYEDIKKSGVVDMSNVKNVLVYSWGKLTKKDYSYIVNNYANLLKKYLWKKYLTFI